MQLVRLALAFALVTVPACKKQGPPGAEKEKPGSGSAASDDKPPTGGSASTAKTPIAASGDALDGVTLLSVAPEHACAVTDNRLWCWDPDPQKPAQEVKTAKPLTTIAGASCGLDDDGNLACWSPSELHSPANSLGGQLVVGGNDICAGHRMIIKCWHPGQADPYNQFDWPGVDRIVMGPGKLCSAVSGGVLECADLTRKEIHAEPVPGPQDVNVLAMAGNLACGVLASGKVQCWTDPGSLKPVPTVDKATDVAVGPTGDACALVGTGFVTCWHTDAGNATTVEASVKQIGGVRGATAIGVGAGYGCAINGDGKVVCWGKASKEPQTAQAVSKK